MINSNVQIGKTNIINKVLCLSERLDDTKEQIFSLKLWDDTKEQILSLKP